MNDMTEPIKLTAADFKSDYKPIWCPGCGDYTVLGSVTKALSLIGRPPHEVAVVSGIGCSRASRPTPPATAFTACTAGPWPPAPG
jgi:2-oxoglutarate ferredoxin oxidoreductase subunit beta